MKFKKEGSVLDSSLAWNKFGGPRYVVSETPPVENHCSRCLVPAMWAHAVGSSDRSSAENQWSLTSCSWEVKAMAEENEVAGPRGRTDVKSLTEMVSMATGESGSEVGEGAAAGRQREMMSPLRPRQRWLKSRDGAFKLEHWEILHSPTVIAKNLFSNKIIIIV